jgi:sigma-54 dependent transcriptional regulator, acetoin dehydrogenase operon transcriptional activator AcoR
VQFCQEMNKSLPRIDQSFFHALRHYFFPGNIRELRNIIEHLVIMHEGDIWSAESLCGLNIRGIRKKAKQPAPLRPHADETEKTAIIEALQSCHGKQKEAARLLGISEPTLTRRIKKYQLGIYTKKSTRL